MKILLCLKLLTLTLSMILIFISSMISKKSFMDREKSSPFECGFDPSSSSRMPFSLHFFLIAIIFLIFDIEITLLFPLIISMKYSNLITYFITLSTFIIILLIGLYHEWNQGALNWTS